MKANVYYHGMAKCYFCKTDIDVTQKIFRNTLCEECGKDLRICKNCRFYSPGAHWDCAETIPDEVRDKERANFCDYFVPGENITSVSKDPAVKEKAKKTLNALFGDEQTGAEKDEPSGKKSFDALFENE